MSMLGNNNQKRGKKMVETRKKLICSIMTTKASNKFKRVL
jgi:hypothetical protein